MPGEAPMSTRTSQPAGDEAQDADAGRRALGARLRALRRERGYTLKALSERSGVALSTLSKIELGQVAVSYEKLAAAARGLQADIAALFDGAAPAPAARAAAGGAAPGVPAAAVVSDLDTAPRYDGGQYALRMLSTGFPGRRMTPMVGRIVARRGGDFAGFVHHPGQEFVLVLRGRVRIEFEHGAVVSLRARQSAYFDSGIGHRYVSVGRGEAELLVVMSEGDTPAA